MDPSSASSHLLDFARHLPRLEQLTVWLLRPGPPDGYSVSVEGLAQSCPQLHTLELGAAVDGDGVDLRPLAHALQLRTVQLNDFSRIVGMARAEQAQACWDLLIIN